MFRKSIRAAMVKVKYSVSDFKMVSFRCIPLASCRSIYRSRQRMARLTASRRRLRGGKTVACGLPLNDQMCHS